MSPHSARTQRSVVAVINSSEDILDLIREMLEDEFAVVTGHVDDFKRGRADFDTFLDQHRPQVVVWDISPPYEDNWEYFQQEVRNRAKVRGFAYVVTTTNQRILTSLVGETGAIEIVGKPYDLDHLATSVRRLVGDER
jgi:DNA-binding response OmpR family regulator